MMSATLNKFDFQQIRYLQFAMYNLVVHRVVFELVIFFVTQVHYFNKAQDLP
jgi:hypothetical protein